MKKYFPKIFLLLLVGFLIIPQISLAAWWNPFTWNWNPFTWFLSTQTPSSPISLTPPDKSKKHNSNSFEISPNQKQNNIVSKPKPSSDNTAQQAIVPPPNTTLCNGNYWTNCPTGQKFYCPQNGDAQCLIQQNSPQAVLNNELSPEEKKWLDNGWITTAQLEAINTNTMNSTQFVTLLNSIKEKIKQNDPYLIQKNILLKYLYNPPLTPSEFSSLPNDIQDLLNNYGKDTRTIQAQISLINQQILNYDFNIDQKFQTLINNYLISIGLPATQPVPTRTNCTWSFGTMNCYSN